MLDLFDILIRQMAQRDVDLRTSYERAFTLADELDAFARGSCPLVELARQVFYGKNPLGIGKCVAYGIDRRFAEDGRDAGGEKLLRNIFDVVAVYQTQSRKIRYAENRRKFGTKLIGFYIIARLFFYINTVDHRFPLYTDAESARFPMSLLRYMFSKWI